VWPDMDFFDWKIRASIADDEFSRLHNHKYTICNINKADGLYTIFWVKKFGKIFSAGIF